jgi:hypothetical protein
MLRLSCLILLAGCATRLPGSVDGGAVTSDLAPGGTGTTPTGTPDLGGPGASCNSVCDCRAGLICLMSTCQKNPLGVMIYCCESSDCPAGSACESQAGGFQQCGGNGGGGFGGFGGGGRPDGGRRMPRDGGPGGGPGGGGNGGGN